MDLNKIAGTGKNSSLRFGKMNHSQYHLLTFFKWHETPGRGGGGKKTKDTVNPLFSPPGSLFISSPFEGGLNRDSGLI